MKQVDLALCDEARVLCSLVFVVVVDPMHRNNNGDRNLALIDDRSTYKVILSTGVLVVLEYLCIFGVCHSFRKMVEQRHCLGVLVLMTFSLNVQ
jgi:hypothetical protein